MAERIRLGLRLYWNRPPRVTKAEGKCSKTHYYRIVLATEGLLIFLGRILAVQVEQALNNVSITTTMVSFFATFGDAFSFSVGGSILQNRWSTLTEQFVEAGSLPEQYLIRSHATEGSGGRIKSLPTSLQEVYREVMAKGLKILWVVGVQSPSFLIGH
ncbi:hypothetical protein BU26DRAFT_566611 [Trematosphaeria pertusa]|uniref:Uncharacterized protein n=1 Tax=Trematosphaeria pertusa TaxID=390896 RepID=A0A6A6IDM1_9PLEO|nr:uncharacterized protein BU26DRAFT_566611 [Trematosphaeria pertusa]KAF2247660.1 hypothetical protein BU26DRAFT_566611 [Trematosphaeria pertusa]